MADPVEETVAAPPPVPAAAAEGASDTPLPVDPPADAAASPEKVIPPPAAPAARTLPFRLLGEDTSVHKALGGGKSKEFVNFSCPLSFTSVFSP
ncbi:hypothetical protein GUJ93_ZPchr0006g42205 [Zizania palustris]|uniref:Uncharacterized protein n=1 Tax=Zizania palustris TaxID=103762 RepID=A0A8J5T0G4_ZIZPA|nr:hypothetical protein GUJ93_ZPchr0006g42205 [Zizania palustris]